MESQGLFGRNGKLYTVLSVLGRGGTSTVVLVRDNQKNMLKACKLLPRKDDKKYQDNWIKEVAAMEALQLTQHENIVKFFDYFGTPDNFAIMMEYCDNGTVQDLLIARRNKLLLDPEIRFLTKQILNAIAFIHSRGIFHRDIKPGNALLNGGSPPPLVVKICDFGASFKFKRVGGLALGRVGTPNFVAPEVLAVDETPYALQPADVWSIGCFLYAMVFGQPPFVAEDKREIIRKVRRADFGFPEQQPIDPGLKRRIQQCLSLDPASRPSVLQLLHDDYFDRSFIPTDVGDIYKGPRDYGSEEAEFARTCSRLVCSL